jgi:hypothetical protein
MHSRGKRFAAAATVALGTLAGVAVTPASAENIGNEGCTPGFWKNHTELWDDDTDPGIGDEPYRPDLTLFWAFYHQGSAFVGAPDEVAQFQDITMLEALQGGGGRGLEGATKILVRAAAAAYLNAAHEGLGYPLRRNNAGGLFDELAAALRSGDRHQMLDLARELDDLNNLGCPL